MTMNNNQSPNESLKITETSPSYLQGRAVMTGTSESPPVLKLVPPSEIRRSKRNFVDIDQLIEREESTPEGIAGITEARAELASELELIDGKTLKSFRLAKGLSQAKLAELMRTSQAHIARLESSADMQVSTMIRLAQALGIDAHAALEAVLSRATSEK